MWYITLYYNIAVVLFSIGEPLILCMQLLQPHVVQQHSGGALPSPVTVNRAITLYYTQQQQQQQHSIFIYSTETIRLSLHLNVNILYRDALFVPFFLPPFGP